jgi:hypothetical protein
MAGAVMRSGSGTLVGPTNPRYSSKHGIRCGFLRKASGYQTIMSERVARIIDDVPPRGHVDHDVVMAAFAAATTLECVGVACVTRLLCMKRPYLFYSVNAKTRQRMRQILGTVPATPTEYLASLAMIRKLRWYAAPRPSDPF